ncbi:hypothetical protein HOF46_01895 [Candidatus Woesearchaeota archaeon]|nr:hypothetical protein [Candidatus Woesearchaeota archaeon]
MINNTPKKEGWTPDDTYKALQLTGALTVSDFGIDVAGETTIEGAGTLELIAQEVLPQIVEPIQQASPQIGSLVLAGMFIYAIIRRGNRT